VIKQKLTQDLENEYLRQELETVKRQNNPYFRAQQQFTQSVSQAGGQFMNHVVMPAMATVSKPFTVKTSDVGKPEERKQSASAGASIFDFSSTSSPGVKAAS
jgi:hypothetical protein